MNKDYYKTLNINSNSSTDEIKKAFRNLSKTHHPDKGGDENTFKEISAAYDTLGNEEKRREYDHQRSNPFHGRQHHGGDQTWMIYLINFLIEVRTSTTS